MKCQHCCRNHTAHDIAMLLLFDWSDITKFSCYDWSTQKQPISLPRSNKSCTLHFTGPLKTFSASTILLSLYNTATLSALCL